MTGRLSAISLTTHAIGARPPWRYGVRHEDGRLMLTKADDCKGRCAEQGAAVRNCEARGVGQVPGTGMGLVILDSTSICSIERGEALATAIEA